MSLGLCNKQQDDKHKGQNRVVGGGQGSERGQGRAGVTPLERPQVARGLWVFAVLGAPEAPVPSPEVVATMNADEQG